MQIVTTDGALAFKDFAEAGTMDVGTLPDELGATDVYVRHWLRHIRDVVTLITHASGGEHYPFAKECDPAEMLAALWAAAVARVSNGFLRPQKVDVGEPGKFVQAALGYADGGITRERLLGLWSSARIRTHYMQQVGDVRQARIVQLRSRVMEACRWSRPEGVWSYQSGEHHTESYSSNRELRRTYSQENVRNFEDIVLYIIHLATGEDPVGIKVPIIPCWSENTTWPRGEVYRRRPKPFPGARWIRFTASWMIEIGLDERVAGTLQAQWDEVDQKRGKEQ